MNKHEEVVDFALHYDLVSIDNDTIRTEVKTRLNRLAELERLAERVEYKSEQGRCSITLSHSADEWGNTKTEHVWRNGDLS